jgi:hypothetical protein
MHQKLFTACTEVPPFTSYPFLEGVDPLQGLNKLDKLSYEPENHWKLSLDLFCEY